MNINLKKKYLHKLVALKVEKIRCIFCYTCNLLYLWKICIVNNMSIENEMWGINISIISVSFYIRTHESIHTCYLRWELFHFFVYVQAHVWQLHVMRDIIARNKLLSFPSSNGERHCDTELPGFRLVHLI